LGTYSIVCKGLYTCPRFEAGTWFIECDMAVRPNTAQEQLDATGSQHLLLVLMAFGLEIRRIAVEYVDVVWLHVDV
jgi:hypothetical protein